VLTYADVCRSQHCTWQLPIFVKGGALMYAQVQTTTVQPLIVGTLNGSKLVSTVAKDGSETLPVIDFGKLPVGQERVIDIKLTNCIERIELAVDTDVTPVSLDPLGPFSVLKYPTRLKAGQSQTISLCFQALCASRCLLALYISRCLLALYVSLCFQVLNVVNYICVPTMCVPYVSLLSHSCCECLCLLVWCMLYVLVLL
jgi:hypothetical protein